MKNIITWLTFQLISTLLIAQNDSILLKICYLQGSADFTERTFLVFDSLNSRFMNYTEIWDDSLSWIPDKRINYFTDGSGDTIQERYESWSFGNWSWTMSYLRSFDSTHHPLLTYFLSSSSSPNDTSWRIHYLFDSSGKLIADTTYDYSTTGYPHLKWRKEYYYSSTNKLDSLITFFNDSTGWRNYSYWKYYRDQNDTDSVRFLLLYNPSTTFYDSSEMVVSLHDSINGADTSYTFWYFEPDWSKEFSSYWNYDSLLRTTYFYSTCSGCGYTSHIYNYSGNTDSLQSEINCQFTHGGLGQCDSCIYYYQPLITGVHEEDLASFKVFPDPASTILNISMNSGINKTEIEIYNLMGILLKRNFIIKDQNASIDISNLPCGTYIIKAKINDSNLVRTFRVLK